MQQRLALLFATTASTATIEFITHAIEGALSPTADGVNQTVVNQIDVYRWSRQDQKKPSSATNPQSNITLGIQEVRGDSTTTSPALLPSLNSGDTLVVFVDAVTDRSHEYGLVHPVAVQRAVEATTTSAIVTSSADTQKSFVDWLIAVSAIGCNLLLVQVETPDYLGADCSITESGSNPPGAYTADSRLLCVRARYLSHDLELLISGITVAASDLRGEGELNGLNGYPVARYRLKEPLTESEIQQSIGFVDLAGDWLVDKADDENVCNSLHRTYQFKSFASAIGFMECVSIGCDIADHHPHFAHGYRKLTVSLNTWDAQQPCVTARDVALARYFERVYQDFFN